VTDCRKREVSQPLTHRRELTCHATILAPVSAASLKAANGARHRVVIEVAVYSGGVITRHVSAPQVSGGALRVTFLSLEKQDSELCDE
jgi:hypothetical protein